MQQSHSKKRRVETNGEKKQRLQRNTVRHLAKKKFFEPVITRQFLQLCFLLGKIFALQKRHQERLQLEKLHFYKEPQLDKKEMLLRWIIEELSSYYVMLEAASGAAILQEKRVWENAPPVTQE